MPSAVIGLSHMDNYIYVMCSDNCVYVCDTSRLNEPPQTIEISGVEKPCDLTVSQEGKQLYIADNTHGDKLSRIWKSALVSGSRITQFAELSSRLMSIAAISSGLLVTTALEKNRARLILLEGDGKAKPINLLDDVSPAYAFKTSDGSFIVCTHDGAVCRFNENGEPMHTYVRGNDPRLLDPYYATLGYGDELLVADPVGFQIFVFDLQLPLRRLRVLLDEKQTKIGPVRKSCFDERSGKLFLVRNDREVSVYKVPHASDSSVSPSCRSVCSIA